MKHVLKFLGVSFICWILLYLIFLFCGANSSEAAAVGAIPAALVLAGVITVISYFVGRIEKLEYTVKQLQYRVGELEKKD